MNVIITGASKGIGYELTKLFVADRDNRVIALSRNLETLTKLQSESGNRENLEILKLDLANFSSDVLLNRISHLERVDILINNAGALINKPFGKTTMDEWQYVYAVNVFGPVRLIKELIPQLSKSNTPHVVNIGSMGGFQGSAKYKGLSAYSSSKAALASLTECLAEDLSEYNISVNCLCLGAVNTEMLREAFPAYDAPLESEEIAEFIYNFATKNNKYINGKILPISLSTP